MKSKPKVHEQFLKAFQMKRVSGIFPLFLPAVLLWPVWIAPALADGVDNDLQQWTMVTFEGPRGKRLRGYLEIQPRLGRNLTEFDRMLVRPALLYQLKKGWSVGAGYAWVPTFDANRPDEHRIWQQLRHQGKLGDWSIGNRTRLEQRFIEDAGSANVRARHQLRVSHPLGKKKKWYAVGYDEFFVNLSSSSHGPSDGYDQNRFFVGLGRGLGDHVKVESGYMLNHVRQPNRNDDLKHVILLQVSTEF